MKAQTVLPFKLVEERDETLTRFAGLPLVAEAFRALGVKKDCDRRLEWKQRRRGLSRGEMVESFVLMLAAGGECLDGFEQMRADGGLCRLVGHEFPAPSTAWQFLLQHARQMTLHVSAAASGIIALFHAARRRLCLLATSCG